MTLPEAVSNRLIGALFVERGLVSQSQLVVALELQQETGQQLVPVESSVEATRAWRRALGQYLSQLEPWQPGWDPLVPPDFVQHHLTQLVVEGASHP